MGLSSKCLQKYLALIKKLLGMKRREKSFIKHTSSVMRVGTTKSHQNWQRWKGEGGEEVMETHCREKLSGSARNYLVTSGSPTNRTCYQAAPCE